MGGDSCLGDNESEMNILLCHLYFWPDTAPYASILRIIGDQLSASGENKVDVLSCQPSYKIGAGESRRPRIEQLQNLRVFRAPTLTNKFGKKLSRVLNAASFTAATCVRVLFGRYDAVSISTMPPVIPAFLLCIAARITKTKFVYHCMDIYPEIAMASGILKSGRIKVVLEWVDAWTVNNSTYVVVLSESMKRVLKNRPSFKEKDQIKIIQNFDLSEENSSERYVPDYYRSQTATRILFAGNVGRFQKLDRLLDLSKEAKRQHLELEILVVGEGVVKQHLEDRARQEELGNITFLPHQPIAVIGRIMEQSHYGVISLSDEILPYAFPSKLASYLKHGLPALILTEEKNDISLIVESSGAGKWIAPSSLSTTLVELTCLEEAQMRSAANSLHEEHFSQRRILPQWVQLYESM